MKREKLGSDLMPELPEYPEWIEFEPSGSKDVHTYGPGLWCWKYNLVLVLPCLGYDCLGYRSRLDENGEQLGSIEAWTKLESMTSIDQDFDVLFMESLL